MQQIPRLKKDLKTNLNQGQAERLSAKAFGVNARGTEALVYFEQRETNGERGLNAEGGVFWSLFTFQ